MAELFASGRIVDAILLLLVIEVTVFALVSAKTGRGLSVREMLGAVAPGVGLLLALRSALTGESWVHTAGWLSLGFAAHLADVWRRWRS